MGIKNVNGRNVYVLEPSRASGTKTTTGKNWADLYTDLRWQVWEEVQKSEMAKLKLDQMGIKAQTDIYEQATRDIRRSITELQKLKAEALAGGSTARQVASSAAKQATLDQSRQKFNIQQRTRALPKQREVTKEITLDRFGRPLKTPTTETTRTTTSLVGAPPELGRTVIGTTAAPAVAEDGKEQLSGIDFLDAEIDKLERQLVSEARDYKKATQGGRDLDILSRTRRAFEADQGVIGQGGTAFGLAPRRRRTRARVDQPLAQERIDQFLQDRDTSMKESGDSLVTETKGEITRLRKLAAEAEILTGDEGGGSVMAAKLYGEAQKLEDGLVDAEAAARTEAGDLSGILESPEFTPRRAGELLLRDSDRPAGEFEPPRMAGQEEVSSPAATRRAERSLKRIDKALDPLREPVPPISDIFKTDEEIVFGQGDVTVEPEGKADQEPEGKADQAELGGGYVFDGQSEIIFGPTGFPIFSTLPQQVPPDVEAPKVVSEVALRGIAQRIRAAGGDINAISGYQINEAKPEDFEPEEEEFIMEPDGPPQASSTRQRKDLYRTRVVIEGTKLARQPKKLDRLAKTNLEKEDRPEHFVIVDKLMATNSGKSNAFDMSYNEISRAYKDNPEQRKEAHSYLVAKDILDGDINEPLA